MQIGAAWVFSIACCDLHSRFVLAHHVSTSGQEGQDRFKCAGHTYVYMHLLRFTV